MLKKANSATILNYNCARNIALESATMCDFAIITFQMTTCTSVGMSLPQIVAEKYRVLYLTSVFSEKILSVHVSLPALLCIMSYSYGFTSM